MGFFDRFKRKTTDAVDDHGQKIGDGVDKAAGMADDKTGDRFSIEVREGERPYDVFQHQYADAAWHGIEIGAETQRRIEVRGVA